MKILIIKPSSFGDIIQANPALTAFRELYPDAQISWLVFDVWADIIDFFPDLNKKIVWKKGGGINEYLRVIREVRKQNFDLVIDLQGLLRTALIAFLSGARRKLGVPGMKEMSWLLIKEVYPEKRALNAAYRSLEPLKLISGKTFEPKFNIRVDDVSAAVADGILKKENISLSNKLVAIVPSARGRAKQWPVEYFKKLISLLVSVSKNRRVIILGNKNTFGLYSGMGVMDFSGRTTLKNLAALLKKCSVVIGLDTGPVHLAAAMEVPTIALFGGSDINETAPVSKNAVIIKKDFKCSPCRGRMSCRDADCLRAISPEEVFEEAKKWIK